MIPSSDLHLHTTFCDGKQTPEQMVLAAIQQGCTTVGFSGHVPTAVHWDLDCCIAEEKLTHYVQEIQRLKTVYADQIESLLGLELDYFSQKTCFDCDYTIGSVHYAKHALGYVPVDSSYEILKNGVDSYYGGDFLALAKDFYANTAQIVEKTGCTIVGHFDLLTKYNEKYAYVNEEDSAYLKLALEALDCVLEKDVLIEFNTGAMARGWRTVPYPAPSLVKRIVEKRGRLILNSDAHSAEHLRYAFPEAVEYARANGVRELWIYQNKRFSPIQI